jgi:hypothetical protein
VNKAAYQLSRFLRNPEATRKSTLERKIFLFEDGVGKSIADHRRCLLRILDKGADDSNFLNKICNTGAFCLPFKLFDTPIYVFGCRGPANILLIL